MSDYSVSAYALAEKLYNSSDHVGVPLYRRPPSTITAWVKIAQRQIAAGQAPMEAAGQGI